MAPSPASLDVGSVIGDYQIISIIGRGGMGKVFKVRNTLSDRIEAMKVLLPDQEPTPDAVERFVREIKVVAGMEHPGIAALRTALRADHQILMVMEYVDGVSLGSLMAGGRLAVPRAVRFTTQALQALAYAHSHGVVHRDIKPSNILITPDGNVKLTDFGIASRTGDSRLTGSGIALGSLHYMSPEQMKAETVDARTDLYSLGVTLFEMITGQLPVPGDSIYGILRAHLQEKPKPAILLAPGIPPALSAVIEKSLEKMPNSRFQSADEFHSALAPFLGISQPQPAATEMFRQSVLETPAVPVIASPEVLFDTSRPQPLASPPIPKTGTASRSWDQGVLENIGKDLAVYVGPVAKVLVNRAAKNAHTIEDLYHALAAEISDPADRSKFLRSHRH